MTDTETTSRKGGLLKTILADPLTHFIAGGAVLFSAWAAFSPQSAPTPDPMQIEISEDDLRQMALVWLSQGRPLPSAEDLQALAMEEATERVLVQEAIALGLDRGDEIIARRLAQKMDFLLADLATLEAPTEEELRAWYAENEAQFVLPPRASFRHLYFSPDMRGAEARAAAADTLPTLAGYAPDDPELSGLADRFMFRDYYGGRTPADVTKEFGPDFTEMLFAQPTGEWLGPIRSGYGWHLVWIDTLEPGRPARFEAVRDDVQAAWLDARYREIRARAHDEMMSRYTLVIADPKDLDLSPLLPVQAADTGAVDQ